MATEKWIAGAGQGLTWGDAFSTATLNSIANGNAILSDIAITNGTALDIFADVSIALGLDHGGRSELYWHLPLPAQQRWLDLRRWPIRVVGCWASAWKLLGAEW